jgi:propionyl-CoA synthetase
MLTLWKNDEAFNQKYLTSDNKYYITGDSGYYDEDGFLHILNRTDDVINVAGHRLSTTCFEEILMTILKLQKQRYYVIMMRLKLKFL